MDKRLFFLSVLLIKDKIFASLMTSCLQYLSIYLFHNISLSISLTVAAGHAAVPLSAGAGHGVPALHLRLLVTAVPEVATVTRAHW